MEDATYYEVTRIVVLTWLEKTGMCTPIILYFPDYYILYAGVTITVIVLLLRISHPNAQVPVVRTEV